MNERVPGYMAEQVPPPKEAPIDPTAEALGLCRGLKIWKSLETRTWRCANCGRMQRVGSIGVQVPDCVFPDDPPEVITENCRRSYFNGSGSGWCLKCAQKLGKPNKLKSWWESLWE